MTRPLRTWLAWVGFAAGGRIADLYSTWRLDPGLQGEQNPVHAWMGAGFGYLVVASVVLLGVLAGAAWWAARRRDAMLPREPGLRWAPFCGSVLGRPREGGPVGGVGHAAYLMGDAGCFVVGGLSYLAAFSNLAQMQIQSYNQLLLAIASAPGAVVATVVLLALLLWTAWLGLRFLDYRGHPTT